MDLAGNVIPEYSKTSTGLSMFALVPPKEGWFMHDNYLYIVNSTVLEKVLLNALFDNPQEVHDLNCPNTQSGDCTDFMEEDFPIDSDLVSPMYDLVVERLTRTYTLPKDEENNAKDI